MINYESIPPRTEVEYLENASRALDDIALEELYEVLVQQHESNIYPGAMGLLDDYNEHVASEVDDVIDMVAASDLTRDTLEQAESLRNRTVADEAERFLEAKYAADWAKSLKGVIPIERPGLNPLTYQMAKATSEEERRKIIDQHVKDPGSLTMPEILRDED